jgi:hypothetical protein
MRTNAKKPRPWKRFKATCKGGKVVSLTVSGRAKGIGKFHVHIASDGHVSAANRSPEEMDMVRAFITFGAKPPEWYKVLVDYQASPVHWLLSKHMFYEALLPEQRGLLCLDMATHVLPLFERGEDTKPHEVRLLRKALRIARPYAMGKGELSDALVQAEDDVFRLGTEVKGKRGALYTTYASIDRSPIAAEALSAASTSLRYIVEAPPLGISRDEIKRIATAALDAAIELDKSQGLMPPFPRRGQLGHNAMAEARWQGVRLVQALDPAKVCRS